MALQREEHKTICCAFLSVQSDVATIRKFLSLHLNMKGDQYFLKEIIVPS